MEQDGLTHGFIHARPEMLVQFNRRIYDLLCYPIFFAHAIWITYRILVVYQLYLRSVTSNLKPLRLGVRSFTELGVKSLTRLILTFSPVPIGQTGLSEPLLHQGRRCQEGRDRPKCRDRLRRRGEGMAPSLPHPDS